MTRLPDRTRFFFEGSIPASKSLLNRAWLVRSYFPAFSFPIETRGDDIQVVRRGALFFLEPNDGPAARPIDCGLSGTGFRFLALRASRVKGIHRLIGDPRLMSRPHGPLLEILEQLGVETQSIKNGIEIHSQGWKKPSAPLRIDSSFSSQFMSGVFVNAWLLGFDLEVEHQPEDFPSRGYFDLTHSFLTHLGMKFELSGKGRFFIPKGQTLEKQTTELEPDMSSAFVLAALGALLGETRIDFDIENSLQPDRSFLSYLKEMGVRAERRQAGWSFQKTSILSGIEADLRDTPDLFPVLAVLCAFAKGESRLYGAPHLALKESNRIQKTAELLRLMGREVREQKDGIEIGEAFSPCQEKVSFHSGQDHRLVMAAALACEAGIPIQIQDPDSVEKSFPEFWEILS
jgi:3-phosphoshikimate 1-carboxyvinyltransferase